MNTHTPLRLLITCCLTLSALAADWPQWRGPNRDGCSTETGLLKQWPDGGPKVVWQVDSVGVGYSSVAIKGDRIFTQGDLDGVEHIMCLNAKDGSTIWAVQPEPVKQALADKLAELKATMDRDSDGTVDEVEALTRLRSDYYTYEKPADGDVQAIATARADRMFKKLDKDADGILSAGEAGVVLRDMLGKMDAPTPGTDPAAMAQQRTEVLMKAADKDADGKLSAAERRGTAIDNWPKRVDSDKDDIFSREEIEAHVKRVEPGYDGAVSRVEAIAFFSTKQPGGDGILSDIELRGYYGGYRNNQGDGPRGTPALDGDKLYTEGGNGDVTCLDAATGKTLWNVNLVTDLGGGRPGWGYSESPLLYNDWVIVTPGGKQGTVAALDKNTGKVVWRSTDVVEGAQYSSPIIATLGGVKQIVQFTNKTVFGIDASNGKFLWNYSNASNGTANCTTPVAFSDHVFASSAYGTGGGLVKISPSEAGQKADEVYFENKMANHHGGIVRVGDFMYGFGNGGLICMDFLTGKIAWTDRSVGKGSLTYADGMLYLLGESHQMALAEATPEAYREHGRFNLEKFGRPSWAHPVVAGGRLYIRNQHRLTCHDIKAQ
ncbi:PQQ-binding-like beta-propeller repeat protein [Prosthecobacter sp.]|uniref:outer membrane protein assembly factor BamB family protein n=1 Tax=Prosthecobacter sp. TaxID=1965333 RepID=UPI002ABA74B0|nr:PQQ-binding-like beta-propeller repeat protein [Prosthecobacter sp.]MDZ4401395.1 PQQ-binding-like beta-propeller repeat protein [Prosthecobacter sp.]